VKADGQLKDLIFTGHSSLGAAVAAVFTMHVFCTNAFPGGDATRKRIHSITFALPLLGGEALANYIERKNLQHHFTTFINECDIVPRLALMKPEFVREIENALMTNMGGPVLVGTMLGI
jgi:hypothetical protein